MLEPQSTFLFILLIAVFAVLMWWMVKTRRVALRVVSASLAFLIAMQVGIMAVNRYFDYYQTWGSAIADLTNQGPSLASDVPESKLLSGTSSLSAIDRHDVSLRLAQVQGLTVSLNMKGPLSHINRLGYVYLPPQYFQPRYSHYKFPVIELIHGQPGEPQDWINVVGVQITLDQLVDAGLAKPAVLVMPNANGGESVSLQCLNMVNGPQDLTYLAEDVPNDITSILRVQPPGPAWGIAGYSEGGFCAANMALQFRKNYGFAGVLSGYFSPLPNQLPGRGYVNPFGTDRALRRRNTPTYELQSLPAGATIPQFWLGAGKNDSQDVANADYFWQELQLHQAGVPLILSPGQHTMAVWRAEIPPMLEWMTVNLAEAAAKQHVAVAKAACRQAPPSHQLLSDPQRLRQQQRLVPCPPTKKHAAHNKAAPFKHPHKR
jgi:enterochelin esterase-like enzyme